MNDTVTRVRDALADAPYDWLALATPAHITYATGYRSVGGDLFRGHRMIALVGADRSVLVGGASDGAAAIESAAIDEYVPFGTFFFESQDATRPETQLAGRNDSLEAALADAVVRLGLGGTVGVDGDAAPLFSGVAGVDAVDASAWMLGLRSCKLPAEVDRLRTAFGLAEAGIDAAIESARVGATEIDLANVIRSTMAAGGGDPRFIVVTAGPRSALSDARPTDRPLAGGDLVRFDIGCTIDGYWSDVGRTAVVGRPDELQAARYAAILAGEGAQLRTVRAGITAGELFDVAVAEVEANGLRPYRRHHCGHGIGLDVYEHPVITPQASKVLETGMVFCVETPYYEIGWGGMMVEDAFVVTDDGYTPLTTSDRSLRVIAA